MMRPQKRTISAAVRRRDAKIKPSFNLIVLSLHANPVFLAALFLFLAAPTPFPAGTGHAPESVFPAPQFDNKRLI